MLEGEAGVGKTEVEQGAVTPSPHYPRASIGGVRLQLSAFASA